ncbi:hypothetical protein [Lacimonas salitolerans]|uniref:Uncharacterized protein n=1 Tax=Lacimonas salitolerans TaxID=1323750 RepID=A0ABW4EGM2_9RHOB
MGTAPDYPSFDDIIGAPQDRIADMILELQTKRQFSTLVHDLNTHLLSGAPAQRDRARRALHSLGFVLT